MRFVCDPADVGDPFGYYEPQPNGAGGDSGLAGISVSRDEDGDARCWVATFSGAASGVCALTGAPPDGTHLFSWEESGGIGGVMTMTDELPLGIDGWATGVKASTSDRVWLTTYHCGFDGERKRRFDRESGSFVLPGPYDADLPASRVDGLLP